MTSKKNEINYEISWKETWKDSLAFLIITSAIVGLIATLYSYPQAREIVFGIFMLIGFLICIIVFIIGLLGIGGCLGWAFKRVCRWFKSLVKPTI